MSSMSAGGVIRAGVVGVGHLGRHHARIYHDMEGVVLAGVADVSLQAAHGIADMYGCPAYNDVESLLKEDIDLLSVAVPTTAHFDVAVPAIEAGVHVLVEKPITATVEEGQALVELAGRNRVVLMVGQSERFNPAVRAAAEVVKTPKFIEVHRLGPFSSRATDVGVVLDLMIHDIDLILNWVGSEIFLLRASGVPVLSDRIDIANARLEFDNGCIANVTASRISMEATRKVRVFQPDSYLSIDCLNQKVSCFRRRAGAVPKDDPMQAIEPVFFSVEKVEPLRAELASFVDAVRKGIPAPVTGEAGLKALALCRDISELITEKLNAVGE